MYLKNYENKVDPESPKAPSIVTGNEDWGGSTVR